MQEQLLLGKGGQYLIGIKYDFFLYYKKQQKGGSPCLSSLRDFALLCTTHEHRNLCQHSGKQCGLSKSPLQNRQPPAMRSSHQWLCIPFVVCRSVCPWGNVASSMAGSIPHHGLYSGWHTAVLREVYSVAHRICKHHQHSDSLDKDTLKTSAWEREVEKTEATDLKFTLIQVLVSLHKSSGARTVKVITAYNNQSF